MVSEEYRSDNEGLTEKLGRLKYVTDPDNSHLATKEVEKCRQCRDKPCIPRCPAEVYRWNHEEGFLEIAYENCVECGVCKIVCPYDNFLWRYPRGGFGVRYKYG